MAFQAALPLGDPSTTQVLLAWHHQRPCSLVVGKQHELPVGPWPVTPQSSPVCPR